MSTAILTGGTGFLGAHVLRRLLRDGWQVFALKRAGSQVPLDISESSRVEWMDVDDATGVVEAFEAAHSVDAIFHLATAYGHHQDLYAPVVLSNVVFPLRLLEIALKRKVEFFLNTDTCFTIDYPYLRAYTLSKKQFVEWGRMLSLDGSMRFVNLELQHPFGPGDRAGKFVPWIIQQCQESTGSIALTKGEQKKDFIYVEDVVDAILCLFDKRQELVRGYSQFECGRGQALSVREFVEMVHRECRSQSKLDFGALPYRPHEVMCSQAEIAALVDLGWRARWSVRDGIAEIVGSSPR